jgi:hypothetical protein
MKRRNDDFIMEKAPASKQESLCSMPRSDRLGKKNKVIVLDEQNIGI